LQAQGPQLSGEYIKKLTGDLWELRVNIQNGICRFPFFCQAGRIIIVTHGFQKKTQKTPPSEIARALTYRGDYLMRSKT
jgi:phage-related protein